MILLYRMVSAVREFLGCAGDAFDGAFPDLRIGKQFSTPGPLLKRQNVASTLQRQATYNPGRVFAVEEVVEAVAVAAAAASGRGGLLQVAGVLSACFRDRA